MTKILIRSQILDLICKLKTSRNFSDKNIEAIILELEKIKDKDFLFTTLLKEIICQDAEFDCVLALIMKHVSQELLTEKIWSLLSAKNISDKKKLFLINILRDLGAKVDYEQIQEFVSDPDNIVDLETKNFLQIAKINPEAQIDFLDFFFTVSDNDKKLLLSSIIDDFASDELANVIAPIIYYNLGSEIIPLCFDALKKSKSYLAFEPLYWVIKNSSDLKLTHLAKKTINELKLMGLRQEATRAELFKDILSNSSPVGYWASLVDGVDNFSLIFARQKNTDEVSTFFTVININTGVSACFGFDAIVYDEFEKIIKRFFQNSCMIPLKLDIGQALLDEAIKNSKNIPYEILCWRTLTYDIVPFENNLQDFFAHDLKKNVLNDFQFKKILNSNFIDSWFFKKGDNDDFDNLIEKICKIKPDIKNIELLIKKNPIRIEFLDKRLLMQAYFLKQIEQNDMANLLYCVIFEQVYKNKLLEYITKKSIYQYFLELISQDNKTNISSFAKKDDLNIDVVKFINLIEDEWTN